MHSARMKNWVKSPQDFAAFFFLEWAVPVEFKMDHVTWLWMQLGHLKSGTEDGSITVLDDTGEAMGSKTNNTGT